ncbi:SOS response-associated peptidase [uncultured Acinetobacter sp.]|mgnify:CR=1 FL=1|uniref:SOS response-associated peptidase n=1 Tax=uncultured Acinetobacter sp. TaxID=165433 RepID=UPI0025D06E34|nr:SOS response-associated peptidase family protein [uncultured Acinetobacter sp.]
MCANFKPISSNQVMQLGLPMISFAYEDEIFPSFQTPLLFRSNQGLEWRLVNFGLVPKWAEDKEVAKHTYNARNETVMEKPSFSEAFSKCQFGVIPVSEFYESKYINGKPQRWAVRRKDGQAFYIAALYEITRLKSGEIVRSATMLSMDAHHHEMMKDFHEPRTDKRSIVVIPHHRLEEWLALKQPNILSFIEGFPVEEFECFYCPKQRHNKNTPQMSMFD